jgi:hypothetical protein
MDIHSEVHSWLWAMEGTCCLSRPMCGNQLEKKLAKQLLFVCLSELPSKRSRWERSQRPLPSPRVMPHVLTEWGLKPLTDPAEAAVLDER